MLEEGHGWPDEEQAFGPLDNRQDQPDDEVEDDEQLRTLLLSTTAALGASLLLLWHGDFDRLGIELSEWLGASRESGRHERQARRDEINTLLWFFR